METHLKTLLDDKSKKIFSICSKNSVFECAELMSQSKVGALLVIDDEKLAGIVSERDILRKIVTTNIDPKTVTVAKIMTTDLITVLPTTTVREAMRIVTENRIRHLPVLENAKLLGIISIGDLTRWAMLSQEKQISSLTHYIQGDQE